MECVCVCMRLSLENSICPTPHESNNSQQTPRPIGKAILHPLGTHPHTAAANWQDDCKCMSNLMLAVHLWAVINGYHKLLVLCVICFTQIILAPPITNEKAAWISVPQDCRLSTFSDVMGFVCLVKCWHLPMNAHSLAFLAVKIVIKVIFSLLPMLHKPRSQNLNWTSISVLPCRRWHSKIALLTNQLNKGEFSKSLNYSSSKDSGQDKRWTVWSS